MTHADSAAASPDPADLDVSAGSATRLGGCPSATVTAATPASGGAGTAPLAAHPRWLDQREQATWRAFLAAHRLVFAALEDDLRAAGLPMGYYEILVQLSEAPGRTLRMSELASFARTSRSRLSHAVERLEQQGWVRREDCPTDRRGAFAVLTDAGLAALGEVAVGHATRVRELVFDRLSEHEQRQLAALSLALVAGLCPVSAARLQAGMTDQPA